MTPTILMLAALCAAGCSRESENPTPEPATCTVVAAGRGLPAEVRETSGLARSAHHEDLFWTHNDRGNEPDLFAVDADGVLRTRTRVTGAAHTDWEDVANGPCSAGACLYVADIGDNSESRESITVYEIAEPAADAATTAPARALHARYPDGARNAEALFVLGGELYIVTKNEEPAVLYRFPAAADGVALLERIRELDTGARDRGALVTGAAVTPDGAWVALRTYTRILFYPARSLVDDAPVTPLVFDLAALGEVQGEGIAFGADGSVWLSSEAEDDGAPQLAQLRCELPRS